ncbi:dihydrofolate reductase [Vitreoscilla massiliensis]|uniref:Dihydrofolate reductase n=1 Tax=Vitreoscilla massiliensis TaxID=1689272 RepID=A0ABY4E189_9NEIS|nr:dihydrofolate reductase [Vitreoscilla massiliensis]UOO89083.1 dihydrofolate reductase [Vitreoscilla massiliensis]UOO89561.1 dihydrofolate reductase [Vitreoscilla massiliensis]
MKITLIATMDGKDGIGKNGTLPWHIPADLKHFKDYTDGKVCVMGRKTWDSLPVKPLPNRENIVVSGDIDFIEQLNEIDIDHCPDTVVKSIDSAIGEGFNLNADELVIIGGASIYEQFLPHATHVVLTHIDREYDCDTFFPEFDKNEWTLTSGKQLKTDVLVRYWERKQ